MDGVGQEEAATGPAVSRSVLELARRAKDAGPAEFDWLNGDIRSLRESYEQAFRVEDLGAHQWQVLALPDRRLELLIQHPRQHFSRDCVIVYFHGGGWIVGSPLTHADVTRVLCELSGMRLVSVDYRLAPEFVAPAPVDDGLAVLQRLLDGNFGGTRARAAILCGDSAGGAIAMAAERKASPQLRERILGVCSLYGAFGLLDSPSLRTKGSRRDGMDQECVSRYWILANPPGGRSPYSVEALAVPSQVPAYLLAASEDPVLDDTLALANAFAGIGRHYILDRVENETHGFLHDVGASQAALAALERVSEWMKLLARHLTLAADNKRS